MMELLSVMVEQSRDRKEVKRRSSFPNSFVAGCLIVSM